MGSFTVTVHTLNQAPKTIVIESEYDLVLADDKACGIVQQISEEEIIGCEISNDQTGEYNEMWHDDHI